MTKLFNYRAMHYSAKRGIETARRPSVWGDWKRGTGRRETIKIVGTDLARLDNAAPDQTEVYNFYVAWNIIRTSFIFFVICAY